MSERQNYLPTGRQRARQQTASLIFSFQLLHITLLKPCQVNQNIDRKISFPAFSHISSSRPVVGIEREESLLSERRAVHGNVRPGLAWYAAPRYLDKFYCQSNIQHPTSASAGSFSWLSGWTSPLPSLASLVSRGRD